MNLPITPENYEAWLLDYAEGRLSHPQVQALMQFLDSHPHLKEDLDLTDLPAIAPAEIPNADWSSLHMPESDPLDLLFFKAVEGTLTTAEEERLDILLANPAHARSFEAWQHTRLQPQSTAVNDEMRNTLFRFGHETTLNDATWEHWLVAYGEGLLTEKQIEKLRAFAQRRPEGRKELAIAGRLKLQPARGIFFPDKNKLYKKERAAVFFLLYRAVGVAAAILIAFALWMQVYDTAPSTPLANKTEKKTSIVAKDTLPADTDTLKKLSPVPAPSIPAYTEEDMRAPGQFELAEIDAPLPSKVDPIREKQLPLQLPEYQAEEQEELLAHSPVPETPKDEIGHSLAESLQSEKPGQSGTSTKSLSEIAEEKLMQRLSLTDEEKDALALTLAKRAAERAGNFLNAEVSKASSETELGENLVYKVRIGSFKVTHSRTK